jgi:hypothetical protein
MNPITKPIATPITVRMRILLPPPFWHTPCTTVCLFQIQHDADLALHYNTSATSSSGYSPRPQTNWMADGSRVTRRRQFAMTRQLSTFQTTFRSQIYFAMRRKTFFWFLLGFLVGVLLAAALAWAWILHFPTNDFEEVAIQSKQAAPSFVFNGRRPTSGAETRQTRHLALALG